MSCQDVLAYWRFKEQLYQSKRCMEALSAYQLPHAPEAIKLSQTRLARLRELNFFSVKLT